MAYFIHKQTAEDNMSKRLFANSEESSLKNKTKFKKKITFISAVKAFFTDKLHSKRVKKQVQPSVSQSIQADDSQSEYHATPNMGK